MKKSKYAAAALFYMSAVPIGAKSQATKESDHKFLYSEDRKVDLEAADYSIKLDRSKN